MIQAADARRVGAQFRWSTGDAVRQPRCSAATAVPAFAFPACCSSPRHSPRRGCRPWASPLTWPTSPRPGSGRFRRPGGRARSRPASWLGPTSSQPTAPASRSWRARHGPRSVVRGAAHVGAIRLPVHRDEVRSDGGHPDGRLVPTMGNRQTRLPGRGDCLATVRASSRPQSRPMGGSIWTVSRRRPS